MKELRVKVPRDMMDALLKYCTVHGEKKPAVVRRALERELMTGWPVEKPRGPL